MISIIHHVLQGLFWMLTGRPLLVCSCLNVEISAVLELSILLEFAQFAQTYADLVISNHRTVLLVTEDLRWTSKQWLVLHLKTILNQLVPQVMCFWIKSQLEYMMNAFPVIQDAKLVLVQDPSNAPNVSLDFGELTILHHLFLNADKTALLLQS